MYTDDPLFQAVGADRLVRLLRCWRRIVLEFKLITAIPEKRNAGTMVTWLGLQFHSNPARGTPLPPPVSLKFPTGGWA